MSLFLQDESEDEELVVELSRHSENQEINDLDNANQGTEPQEDDAQQNSTFIVDGTANDHGDKGEEQKLYPLIPIEADCATLQPNIAEIRPVDIQLSFSLPFQHLILESMLVAENSLLVIGKGLGVLTIVSNLLYALSTPTRIEGMDKRSLVLLLNATPDDESVIEEELTELQWSGGDEQDGQNVPSDRPFSVISSESFSIEQRSKRYEEGGIISLTSRILIVDLLSGIVNPRNITGLLILHAEKLHSLSIETFIAEIYRNTNKWGFIKAVTDAADSMVNEFAPLSTKMKDLMLKKTLLWPRFHADISSCLNTTSNKKVIEIRTTLTDSMSKIQFGLYECLKKCIDELSRKNHELATEYWSFENALDSNFMRSINGILSPKWHRISYESKQLVKDIATLRKLLKALISYDALDFYELIQLILDANKPSVTRKYCESPWLLAEESQLVISFAKKRVMENNAYNLEPLPKWEQLCALLDDITHERGQSTENLGPTLILCADTKTSNQLRSIIKNNSNDNANRKMMLDKLQLYLSARNFMHDTSKEIIGENEKYHDSAEIKVSRAFHRQEVNSKRRRTRGSAYVAAVDRLRNAQLGGADDIDSLITEESIQNERNSNSLPNELEDELVVKNELDSEEEISIIEERINERKSDEMFLQKKPEEIWQRRREGYCYVNKDDQLVIETFSETGDESLLYELLPSFVIIYEPNLAFIRKLEVYKAIHRHNPPRVFFMYYGDSVEEQMHLNAIKKEKKAYTKLIREHANMAEHFETTEDLSRFKNLAHRKMQQAKMKNTRIAGGQEYLSPMTHDVVVVDMREFRAPLPGLLYRYGVRVVPCMIAIGDYIITPDICIERKSIADLIGSFKNGRLDKQMKRMAKYYKYPTLLIEFDDSQSFSLEPFSERGVYGTAASSTVHPISSKLMQDEIQREISSLVMKYPTMKIVWSSSPLQTVNIILDLKVNRQQPDPLKCVEIGSSNKKNTGQNSAKDNKAESERRIKGLLSIPGLTYVDYYTIKKRIKKFDDLASMKIEDLQSIVSDNDLCERIKNYVLQETSLNSED